MKGTTLFALPKGESFPGRFRSVIELLFREKARPRGVDLIAAGKCPYGAISPVACMFCQEGHILDCHAGKTCQEARCSHYLAEVEMIGNGGINLERESAGSLKGLLAMEREAHP